MRVKVAGGVIHCGVGEILVATSGYSYDDWVGPVYPPGTDRRDFLAHYARRFAFTELNFSYYREPTAEGLRQITAKTPPGFRFVIKAHRALTHDRTAGWQRSAERFLEALEGFDEPGRAGVTGTTERPAHSSADAAAPDGGGIAQGERDRSGVMTTPGDPHPPGESGQPARLLGILLQFPYSFHYDQANRRHLASVADALAPARLFVEFRNNEWDKPRVWSEMERRELGLVIPDLPRLNRLPATAPRLTSTHGYVRFHGRNEANWWNGTNVTRYDYRYSAAQLSDWVEPVREMATQGEAVIVAFNNHFAGQAVENAQEFMQLLGVAV